MTELNKRGIGAIATYEEPIEFNFSLNSKQVCLELGSENDQSNIITAIQTGNTSVTTFHTKELWRLFEIESLRLSKPAMYAVCKSSILRDDNVTLRRGVRRIIRRTKIKNQL
jgi:hypothetical protein